jgi:hypothetical protein
MSAIEEFAYVKLIAAMKGLAAGKDLYDNVVADNKISRRVVPRERLGDLARDPLRGWFAVTPNDTQSRRPCVQ